MKNKNTPNFKELTGTSYYIAPEVINQNYDERCDVWSIGVIMYILLTGKPPFDGDEDKDIFNKVLSGRYDMSSKIWKTISEEGKRFLKRMLTMDYKKRPYAKDLLNDPWFKNAPS